MARMSRVSVIVAMVVACATGAWAGAPESKRLSRAKDLIADEQWTLAIVELRAAAADPKEPRRDEALYWLANSLNQSGDQASAVEAVSRLERDFPKSMWLRPARSLRIEIAVRLNRSDVLWWTAMSRPQPWPEAPIVPPGPDHALRAPQTGPAPSPPAPAFWFADKYDPDADLRIQALAGLMKDDAERVVPMLGQIAFESENPGPASRAVFMLAQSSLPKARETVVRVARQGPEPVRVAAVRDLGRFGGPEASRDLVDIYATAIEPVKLQIVKSLAERSEKAPLLRIAESEKDGTLRFTAINGLGQAGGALQLAMLYKSATLQIKRPIIVALFAARADVELIRIADTENDAELKKEARERLRLLATPKAKDYLQKVSEKR
jgi:hypothetical protein